METLNRTFELEKETKNTFRFEEVTNGAYPVFGKLYVQKGAFNGEPPEQISVTVEESEQ